MDNMAPGTAAVTQAMINESFGLKRLLALTEEFVQNKISCAVDYAAEAAKENSNFDKSNLRTDQCYTLSLLYGLIKRDAALCSILGMSSEFFEPLVITQITPWLRDGFQFTREDLIAALKYAIVLKKQQVTLPDSAFKAIVQFAKDTGVIDQRINDSEISELMESLNLDLTTGSSEVHLLLYQAAITNTVEAVERAVQAGADPNYILDGGITALHLAVNMKCLKAAQALLDAGARVDAENSEGTTPLCIAVKNCYIEMVKLLLSKGAQINYLNASGYTALHIAAREGFGDIIQTLIDGRVDVQISDSNGNTALHWAAAAGREDMVRLLYSKGASVNTISKNGWTPLHAAAEYNHQNVVAFLIDAGAELNAAGEGGFTPIHMAADKGHVDIVKLFVRKGAIATIKSNDGSTPLDMARESDHIDVVTYLQSLVN